MNYFAFVGDFFVFVLLPIAAVIHERKQDYRFTNLPIRANRR
jgi:hypothetical protein